MQEVVGSRTWRNGTRAACWLRTGQLQLLPPTSAAWMHAFCHAPMPRTDSLILFPLCRTLPPLGCC
jgi:hypothetical protein